MTGKTPFPLISVTVWLELVPRERNLTSLTGFSLRGGSTMGEGSILRDSRPTAPCVRSRASSTHLSGCLFGWLGWDMVPSRWEPRRGWFQREHFYRLPASSSPFPFLCSYFDNRPEISPFPSIFSPSSVTDGLFKDREHSGSGGKRAHTLHSLALACSLPRGG